MQEEIWKDIRGHEGIYQVSNKGRVKRVERVIVDSIGRKRTLHEKIIKIHWFSENGYPVITLGNGINNNYYVHQLVANAFIPNPDYDFKVRHKNKNKSDNRVENLYRLPWDRPIKHTVYIDGDYKVKTFSSVTEAAQQTGKSTEWIRWDARQKYSNWEYVED